MKLQSIVAVAVLFSTVFVSAHAASFSAGIDITDDVAAEKTGLRVYPGATPVLKKKGDSESANIQFAFGDYGLKVVVVKLRSADAPATVAAFYRGELSRFGEVLDCGNERAAPTATTKDRKSKVLTCDGDKPRKSGMLYKVGRRDDQHVVEIKSVAAGSEFSLVHVNVKSPD
ncbi:MAG: hypothetical protein ABI583_03755 [Betaproteobacteria bacterium]